MLYGISDVAVLVTVLLSIAIGSVWYSQLMFGRPWMSAVGFTEEDIEAMKGKMPRLFALAFVANAILLYALARFVDLSGQFSLSILNTSVWLTVLLAAAMTGSAVWEQKPLSYLFINIGFIAIVVIGGMHVIAFWPW